MELELDEKEAAVIIEALECLIAHPTTTTCKAEQAIDLSHFLLALSCGHFDDWGDDITEAEEDFINKVLKPASRLKQLPVLPRDVNSALRLVSLKSRSQ